MVRAIVLSHGQLAEFLMTSVCLTKGLLFNKELKLYLTVEGIGVKYVYPGGGDSFPHVGVCCKLPVSQVLLKESKSKDVTGHTTSTVTSRKPGWQNWAQ
jgi:hypothetical protein